MLVRKKWITALLAGAFCLSSMVFPMPVQNADAAGTRVAVHDPSVIKLEDGSYYIIGSHLGAARSSDLQNWSYAANSNLGSTRTTFFNDIYTDLAIPAAWSNTSAGYDLSGNLWAPDIIWNPHMNKYCMYLSVNGVDWHSSIVLCTADQIDGPYTYVDTIVWSGFETNPNQAANHYRNTDVERVLGTNPDLSRYLNGAGRWNAEYGTNAIDACTFFDENGKLWMVYGSWFGGIYMLELDEQTGLRDYNVRYETRANGGSVLSDAYMGIHVAGGHWVSGEGPYIEYMKDPATGKGYYYLFMSYGYFNNKGGYNMRVFRSESPEGPYVDQNGNSAIFAQNTDNIAGNIGQRLMSNYQWSCNEKPNTAQGHNSVLMDDDGKLFCIYHNKFDDNYGAHEVRVHQMIMNEEGWPTATSYEYSGETLSQAGHTMEAIIGDYELIWHNPNQRFENEVSADVEKPINITLNADGTVTGDIEATWEITKNGTPYMSFTWGGVTYKGAFIVQKDESPEMVTKMTFTATDINICIWGSKKEAYSFSEDIVNTTPIADGTYTIRNVNSSLYLNADAFVNNGSAEQNREPQVWKLAADADGWYTITTVEGKALTVVNGSPEDGTDLVIADATGSTEQKFRIMDAGSGRYALLTAVSNGNSCADVYNISTEVGANICQWEYWGGDGQKFILEAADAAVLGDVNADGVFTIADVVMLRKWLVCTQGAVLTQWQAGDFNGDDKIDARDLSMMKTALIRKEEQPSISAEEYTAMVRGNMVNALPAGADAYNPAVDYGTVQKCTYYSTTRERMTPVNVLLPAGYHENETYPVLYMLHGYFENQDSLLSPFGGLQNILGNQVAAGNAEKMIVVFPYVYTSKTMETCTGMDLVNSLNYDNFIHDLRDDLMPFINETFSVKTGREHTAISGFSMGGRESQFIGLEMQDVFGYVGAVCPAPGLTPGFDLSQHPGQLSQSELIFRDPPYLFLLSAAVNDTVVGNSPGDYHNMYNANGVDHVWNRIPDGAHDPSSIRPHFYNFIRNIFHV